MSKRPGAVSNLTRQAILQAAEKEFSERGFQGASLRRISTAAGVTTGAIYFFFSGKDELFETVLSGVTEPFMTQIKGHYGAERNLPGAEEKKDGDFAISLTLIELYFQNQRAWDILLKHQSHPAVQKFLDDFVDESVEHYRYLLSAMGKPVDRFAIHQFVHMQADTMLTLISHGFSREEITAHARTAVIMLRGAFQALLES